LNQIIDRLKALAAGAAVGYHRLDGMTIRVTSGGFLTDEVDAWGDGDPVPTYQGRLEPGAGLGRFRAMTANGKPHNKTDVLREHSTGLDYVSALAVLLDHRSQRPVRQPWDDQAAAAAQAVPQARPASLVIEPTLVLYRPDQGGAYYLDGAELVFVPEIDGFLDFTAEVLCDDRCDGDVRAVQIECEAQLSQPGWATAPGRVLVWIADPTLGQGYNAHWLGNPCWECGYEKVYDPHNARPVPCTQPEAHAQVAIANWRGNGCTTATARLISMTADDLRARYGMKALPVAAGESVAIGQSEEKQ